MSTSDEQRQPWARVSEGSTVHVVASQPLPVKANAPIEVQVVDIHMSFGSMVSFMVKWSLASIPAFLILLLIGLAFYAALMVFVQRMAP